MAYRRNRRFKFRKNFNIGRVISKLAATVISLWVGGTIVTEIGNVMNGTTSSFYQGLTLIGWTVTNNQIVDTSDSGVLAVIGIIGIASIALEFVEFKL